MVIGAVLIGGVALAAVMSSPTSRRRPMSDLERRIARLVLRAESGGRYTAINPHQDGAGISVGLLQWSQQGGGLAELLRAWRDADAVRLRAHLGPQLDEVIARADARSLEPVGGHLLWSAPWLARWKAALADPIFQQVQDELVVRGSHMRGAVAAARVLGTTSPRGLALLFDRAVQQGTGAVQAAAARVAAKWPTGTEDQRLRAVADDLVERFRRSSDPGPQPEGARLHWRRVGSEWHKFSGDFDLYRTARSRADAILTDTTLT